jgi:hypothetical protein
MSAWQPEGRAGAAECDAVGVMAGAEPGLGPDRPSRRRRRKIPGRAPGQAGEGGGSPANGADGVLLPREGAAAPAAIPASSDKENVQVSRVAALGAGGRLRVLEHVTTVDAPDTLRADPGARRRLA